MKLSNCIFLVIAIVVVFLTSCEEEGDKQSPIVDMNTPSIGQSYQRSGFIRLNANFTDEGGSGLKECILEISPVLKGWDTPWAPKAEVVLLQGNTHSIEDHIIFNGEIPYNIMSGEYVIGVRVTDNEGNLTQFSRNITILE